MQDGAAIMRIWVDTEFIEDGKTIELLSIGAVREDGAQFYAEIAETDRSLANPWVLEHVFPGLTGPILSRAAVASILKKFAGPSPEFWAYFCSYDWVALCQLYGTMMDLPNGWPMYCRDLKQLVTEQYGNRDLHVLVPQVDEHNALADARWTRDAHLALTRGAS
jgi:hypothetical protein